MPRTAIIPHVHQEEGLSALEYARLAGAIKALVIMASGLGKTILAILDAKRFIEEHGGRVLILCHRNDILDQLKKEFEDVMEALSAEYTFGMYNGTRKTQGEVDFLFASFQTMGNDLRRAGFAVDEFSYIVVDEAHHAPARTFYSTLKYFQPLFLLGMTATPDRKDKADLNAIFGDTVFELRFPEAIARGLLAEPKVRLLMDEVAILGEIYWKEAKQKISASELNKRMFAGIRDKAIVEIIREETQIIPNPRTVVFCRGVKHAENIAALIDGAVLFHSYEHRLPKQEAKQNLQAFRDGTAKTIVVIDKLNEGIDVPEINVIVNLRQLGSRITTEQQLGRGLRKIPGKDFVLVLDFVANCQRLKMYWEMDRDVREFKKVHPDDLKMHGGGNGGSYDVTGLDITTNDPTFQREDLDLMGVIKEIVSMTEPYTKEVLISQLQKWSKDNDGRTPTIEDLSADNTIASIEPLIRHFGSVNDAMIAAGLAPNRKKYTDDMLIIQLKEKARRLKGKSPTMAEVDQDENMASSVTFISHFGTWGNALSIAGLDARYFSDANLLEQLRRKTEQNNGIPPTCQEIDSDRNMASSASFFSHFGSVNQAILEAGLVPRDAGFTKEELIAQLKFKFSKLGRVPQQREVQADKTMASAVTFSYHFGSFAKAITAAGLVPARKYLSDDELLTSLRKKYTELGRSPKQREVDADIDMPSARTFADRFCTFNNALQAAGLPLGKRGK